MGKNANLARMTTATTLTGTITLGAAVPGCLTFAQAGVVDGDVVSYGIGDGANSEVGIGTIGGGVTTLTRTVTNSTNSNAAISLSGTAEVFITPRAEDLKGMMLIRRQAFSAVSSVDFTSGIDATFEQYVVLLSDIVISAANTVLSARFSQAGSFVTSASYDHGHLYVNSTSTAFDTGGTSDTKIDLCSGVTNAANCSVGGTLQLRSPAGTSVYKHLAFTMDNANPAPAYYIGSGVLKNSAAVDGIRIYPQAGTFSGVASLYGMIK